MSSAKVNSEEPKKVDDASDNEFHDAEDTEHNLEEKFADALDFVKGMKAKGVTDEKPQHLESSEGVSKELASSEDEPKEEEPSDQPQEPQLSEEELQANKEKAESLKQQGNDVFKAGEYEKSIELYTDALEICPKVFENERSILYNNRAAAHKHLGYQSTAIEDCTQAIELNPKYVKALIRRAALYEETDKMDECFSDYNKVVEIEPTHVEARAQVARLKPIIDERNEKLKAEMMGKLKDLGNMILKPFGLSTNNFQLQQDPNTGSYSVNFNQNSGN